jgi:predicted ATPase
MEINSLSVHNYRSIRKFELFLPRFAVFAGINAAGKSNFCDSLDFIAEVYRHGLRVAVSRKGGYESICFRRARRSKSAIDFQVDISFSFREGLHVRIIRPHLAKFKDSQWRICHRFSFKAESDKIGADFRIEKELLDMTFNNNGEIFKLLSFERDEKKINLKKGKLNLIKKLLPDYIVDRIEFISARIPEHYQETELFITYLQKLLPPIQTYCEAVGSFRVYQISPRYGREPGVPIPQPELERFGNNLPTILAYFRENEKRIFRKIISKMHLVIPELESIDINYVYRKRYGLFFKEKGITRPWTAEDVSDGTIQFLAMLAAVLDPRSKLTVIEEPENSVHSWILSNFVETCREASESKYIFLTTHSITLVDILKPEELFVAYKSSGETNIDRAINLDTDLKQMLEEGYGTLGEYIHSGGIPKLIPSGDEE